MAITIQEILASDTVSQLVDKINLNFDQLLLNGGGPPGSGGGIGLQGIPGANGTPGNRWYTDTLDPNLLTFIDVLVTGDKYLQANGYVWEYSEISGLWIYTFTNLQGPPGSGGGGGGSAFTTYNSVTDAVGDLITDVIYPSINPDLLTGGRALDIPAVLIGGYPTGTSGSNLANVPFANSELVSANASLIVHSASGSHIKFSNYDSTAVFADLPSISTGGNDTLIIDNPKTIGTSVVGILLNTSLSQINLQSGKDILMYAKDTFISTPIPTLTVGSIGNIVIANADKTGTTSVSSEIFLRSLLYNVSDVAISESYIKMLAPGTATANKKYISLKSVDLLTPFKSAYVNIGDGTNAYNLSMHAGTSLVLDAATYITAASTNFRLLGGNSNDGLKYTRTNTSTSLATGSAQLVLERQSTAGSTYYFDKYEVGEISFRGTDAITGNAGIEYGAIEVKASDISGDGLGYVNIFGRNSLSTQYKTVIDYHGYIGVGMEDAVVPDQAIVIGKMNNTPIIKPENKTGAIGTPLRIQGGNVTGGTNFSGGTINIVGGDSTGTGTSDIRFLTATAGSSGSAVNSVSQKAIITGSGYLGLGLNFLTPAYILDTNDTGAYRISVGTTASRPSTLANGLIRYNTDLNRFEGYSRFGTTIPGWRNLQGLASVDNNTRIEPELASADNKLRFYTNNTERFYLDSSSTTEHNLIFKGRTTGANANIYVEEVTVGFGGNLNLIAAVSTVGTGGNANLIGGVGTIGGSATVTGGSSSAGVFGGGGEIWAFGGTSTRGGHTLIRGGSSVASPAGDVYIAGGSAFAGTAGKVCIGYDTLLSISSKVAVGHNASISAGDALDVDNGQIRARGGYKYAMTLSWASGELVPALSKNHNLGYIPMCTLVQTSAGTGNCVITTLTSSYIEIRDLLGTGTATCTVYLW